MAKETRQFQAEVKQILDLMVHSLYSQSEIFLRELISNASDALDKLRYESLTHTDWKVSTDERHIRLAPDTEQNTLSVIDNGIGMSFEEVEKNLGTIAQSGTKEFLELAKAAKDQPELIGQFGVGFYSVFMVAEKVIVHTQRVDADTGVLWESTGDGTYTIDKVPRPEGHGTTVCVQLKKSSEDEGEKDFTQEWTLRELVRRYSDFIAYPIRMKTFRTETPKNEKGEETGPAETIVEDVILNSQKALWLRPAKDISEEEYKEFYQHISHDWAPAQRTIHFRAEGVQEFVALLYIPSQRPFDYFQREAKYGPNLYIRRVFIMNDCDELLPNYLRFLKGIIDSSDLSLNVSREILQKDRQVQQIRKALVGRVLNNLKDFISKERTEYEKFWQNFGASLKEAIPSAPENKEKIQELLLFCSTKDSSLTTLSEYVSRMPSEQTAIYYLTGESMEQMKASPYLEQLKARGFEVLLLNEPIDEWVVEGVGKYMDKDLVSITSSQFSLDEPSSTEDKEQEKKQAEEKLAPLKGDLLKALEDKIKAVEFSSRLVDSPVCLVTSSNEPSARMEKIMGALGHDVPKGKRILEINPKHPLFERMLEKPDDTKKEWAEILYNQALLNEGSQIDNPSQFSQQITRLMTQI